MSGTDGGSGGSGAAARDSIWHAGLPLELGLAEAQQTLLQIAPLNRRAAPEVVGMREVIQVITQLDAILGRPLDIEEALALIEEAKIG